MPAAITKLITSARVKHVPKGQILLYVGDDPAQLMMLKTGVVKIHDIDAQGNEKVLHLLKPLAVLPLAFFSGGAAATKWFYTALTDCDLYVVPKDVLQRTMETDGQSAVYLLNWFSREV